MVASPELRSDLALLLELLRGLGPGVVVREGRGWIAAEIGGATLCRCVPQGDAIQLVLGAGAEEEVVCRGHEDLVSALSRLLARVGAQLPAAWGGSGTSPPG
jgi:hypothetical protein